MSRAKLIPHNDFKMVREIDYLLCNHGLSNHRGKCEKTMGETVSQELHMVKTVKLFHSLPNYNYLW